MKEKILEYIKLYHPTYLELCTFFNNLGIKDYILSFEQDGLIDKVKNKYYLTKELNMVPATIVSIKERFSFAAVGEEEEVYIANANLKNAFVDDRVLLKKISNFYDKRDEFEVIKITKRARKEVVGEVHIFGGTRTLVVEKIAPPSYLFLIQDNEIEIQNHQVIKAKIVKISSKCAIVEPLSIIGHKMDVGVDVARIILSNNAPMDFPSEVEKEVKKIPTKVLKKELEGREDFRDHLIVTIDGEDAKDFDDAVEVIKEGDLYHVGVHIADVAHYVKEGSEIEKEALNRATSLYVRDRVVPMLPFELSNGICSLNPHVDRLVTSCLFTINKKGNIVYSRICKGVIKSKHRLTYTYVNEFLHSHKKENLSDLENMLLNLYEVSLLIRNKRRNNGAVELSSTELVFNIASDGVPYEVNKRETDVGEKLIEDLMICANEVVASTIEKMQLPMVYRIHEHPKAKKLESFKRISLVKGYPFFVDLLNCTPKDIASYVENIKEEDKEILSNLLLRCMAKAKYSVENKKHFGLASKSYTHFTSPIRRYPDLMVHRLIDRYIINNNRNISDEFKGSLQNRAMLSSQRERRALVIERSVEALLSAKYMHSRLGDEYEAKIVSMVSLGMFVEISNGIQGFVSFESISGDYYVFDEASYLAFGVRKGRRFHLGEKVNVICCNVDIDHAQISFALLQDKKTTKIRDSKKRKGSSHNGRKY